MSAQLLVAKKLQSSSGRTTGDRRGDSPQPFLSARSDDASRTLFLEVLPTPTAAAAVTAPRASRAMMGYGMDYSPDSSGDVSDLMIVLPPALEVREGLRLDLEDTDSDITGSPDCPEVAAAAAYLNRVKAARARAAFDRDMLDSSSDEEELLVTPPPRDRSSSVPPAGELLTQTGVCETLYIATGNSQPVLLAMVQGIVCRPGDPYSGVYVFDVETDDLLKAFPQAQKKLYYPIVNHLKDEAARRAKVFNIKPLKKSANKPELMQWLKDHPVSNSLDENFLRFEAGKTYRMIQRLAEEAQALELVRQASRSWTDHFPWMRFYHCIADDDVIVSLVRNMNVLTRAELDARNSEEKPPEYWVLIAEKFNDPNTVYVSYAVPELHSTFGQPITLTFENMPGGAITPDECKIRYGDARAKLISVSS
jgi:hypothetical protein